MPWHDTGRDLRAENSPVETTPLRRCPIGCERSDGNRYQPTINIIFIIEES